MALGVSTTGGETQTVTFSQNVVDPIIYVAFADLGMLLDFGAIPVTLLDNNDGTLLAGHTVHFGVLATDSVNDGFAARLTGTFGPGAPLQFLIDPSTPQASVAFTLGLPANVNAAPVCTDVSATGTSEEPTVVPLSCQRCRRRRVDVLGRDAAARRAGDASRSAAPTRRSRRPRTSRAP